jgi:hypothetical protein
MDELGYSWNCPKTNTAYVANPGDDTMSVLAPCPK